MRGGLHKMLVKIAKRLLAIVILLSFVVLFSSAIVINVMHISDPCHSVKSTESCTVCTMLKQTEQLFRPVAIAFIAAAIIFFAVIIINNRSQRDFSASLIEIKARMNH